MGQDHTTPPSNVISLFGHARAPAPPPEPDEPRPPELRPAPEPPAHQDPRQTNTSRILGNLQAQLPPGAGATTVNMTRGMAAADVRVGALQELLEAMIVEFDMDSLRPEWSEGIQSELMRAIEQWVQRLRELTVELRENGIHVKMQTQDDRGYYRFAFDVFPGRKPPRA